MPGSRLIKLTAARQIVHDKVGERPGSCTLIRWITRGINANGQTVRLRASRIGTRWYTTAEDVNNFIDDLTAGSISSDAEVETANQKRRVVRINQDQNRPSK